jgi:hypothetical protein
MVLRFRVGIDTGGTFTDLVALGAGRTFVVKVPSTPRDPERGVLHALRELALRHEREFPAARGAARPLLEVVHGTTVATNAVLEGRGARVVLVTNAGFEDLIEIGRRAPTSTTSRRSGRPRSSRAATGSGSPSGRSTPANGSSAPARGRCDASPPRLDASSPRRGNARPNRWRSGCCTRGPIRPPRSRWSGRSPP